MSSADGAKQLQPVGPVAGELEEVLEVGQAAGLELLDYVDERVTTSDWPDRDETTFDPEFFRRQAQTLVDLCATEARSLIGRAADEHSGCAARDRQWHCCPFSCVRFSIALGHGFFDLTS